MDRPTLVAVTPSLSLDPAIAIAACRAGALGIFDVEYAAAADQAAIVAGLRRLEEFTDSDFGVKLGPGSHFLLDQLLANKPPRLAYAILAGGDGASTTESLSSLRRAVIWLMAEATSVDEAQRAAELGFDAVVLKGNEAGGRVGHETAFILLQHWRAVAETRGFADVPVWIQGGIGPNSAAACAVGGATGVVLDSQLLLTRETPVGDQGRARLQACDGSETVEVGRALEAPYRVWTGPQSDVVSGLDLAAATIAAEGLAPAKQQTRWRATVEETFRNASKAEPLLLCGQDAALAKSLADRYVTVGGVLGEIQRRMNSNRHSGAASPAGRRRAARQEPRDTLPAVAGPDDCA